MRHTFGLLAASLILAIAFAQPALAQEDGGGGIGGGTCTLVLPDCGGLGQHKAETSQFPNAGESPYAAHSECKTCQSYGSPTNSGDCHACSGGLDDAGKAAYAMLLRAGRDLNVSGVLSMAGSTREFVRYNTARSSIQILGCDKKSVIANIRLETDLERRIAASSLSIIARASVSTEQ